MGNKRLLIAVVIASALGTTGLPAPAQASTFGKAAYRGVMSTSGGFTAPVPIGTPPVVYAPRTSAFTFSSSSCDGTKTDVGKAKGTNTYGNLCTIHMTGTVTGYCGRLTAAGSGTLYFHRIANKSFPFTFTFEVVGSKLALRGTSGKGLVVGGATIAPDASAGQSCTTPSGASRFLVAGKLSVAALHPPSG